MVPESSKLENCRQAVVCTVEGVDGCCEESAAYRMPMVAWMEELAMLVHLGLPVFHHPIKIVMNRLNYSHAPKWLSLELVSPMFNLCTKYWTGFFG